jgi:predicted nucleotide-binding protein
MTDEDLRGRLLKHFFDLRNANDGSVGVSENILSPAVVTRQAIALACEHMAEVRWIKWMPLIGADEGHIIGRAKILGYGVDVVKGTRAPDIAARFPNTVPVERSPLSYEAPPLLADAPPSLLAGLIGQSSSDRSLQPAATATAHPKPSNKVFVVHGRDDATKNEVALFLRSIGLEPIILHTRPHGGRNILTKFQEESQGAGFAVILMTPDDEGALIGEAPQKRARQNVVFEFGFFIGKLRTPCVAALVKGRIEKPSDFDGIGYIDFDAKGEWKRLLAREMQYAEVPFDASKVFTA